MSLKKFSDYDTLTAAVLRGSETFLMADVAATATVTASTISATASTDTISDSGAGLPVVKVGALVLLSGFTDTAGELNAIHTVVSSTASNLVVATDITVDEAAGASVTVSEIKGMYQLTADELATWVGLAGSGLQESGDTVVNIRETEQTVTSGSVDASLGAIVHMTLSAAGVLNVTNLDVGQSMTIHITNGNTHGMDWATNHTISWHGAGVPVLGAVHTVELEQTTGALYGYDAGEVA